MSKLTNREYWDQFWHPPSQAVGSGDRAAWASIRRTLREKVGTDKVELFTRSYADFVLWERIYPEYLNPAPGATVLEIGSAPGSYLIRLRERFGLEPYGVDYSEVGVAQNRELFRRNGLDPDRIVLSDAFDRSYLAAHREQFDIVLSRGVIEHFTEHRDVMDAHTQLLKPGGRLAVSIPNFRGINYGFKWIFSRESLPSHNLGVMKLDTFSEVFREHGLLPLFCGYYGTIDLGMFGTLHRGLKWAYQVLDKTQVALNGVLRLLFASHGPESRLLSPHLLYIGEKTK